MKASYRLFALLLAAAILGQVRDTVADEVSREFSSLGQGEVAGTGTVSPLGGYGATVPLGLPPARGGVSVPIGIAYDASNDVSELGVGWRIPKASVFVSRTLAQRKPNHDMPSLDSEPRAVERVFLDLGGGPMLMVPDDAVTYVPFVANEHITLRRESSATWRAEDLRGTTYTFSRVGSANEGRWYLTEINDFTGANRIEIRYRVDDVIQPVLLSDAPLEEFLIDQVRYNFDTAGKCPKHVVSFDYSPGGRTSPHPELLDVTTDSGHLRVHTKLLSRIRVLAHEDLGCTAPRVLRTHEFTYEPDRTTGKPRLIGADAYGLDDDATDPSRAIPIAEYAYESALSKSDVLDYSTVSYVKLPETVDAFKYGFANMVHLLPGASVIFGSTQFLRDVTGDGRMDYVFPSPSEDGMRIAANLPKADGSDASTYGTSAFYAGGTGDSEGPKTFGYSGENKEYKAYNLFPSTTFVWKQFIDFNGDGRLDLLDSRGGKNSLGKPSPEHWRVLINRAGPSGDPSDITWEEHHLDISLLRKEIGHFYNLNPEIGVPNTINGEYLNKERYLPLSRSTEAINTQHDGTTSLYVDRSVVTEWMLQDLNADGFPEFVFSRYGMILSTNDACDRGDCVYTTTLDIGKSPIVAFYHTGPAMAGATPQPVWKGSPVLVREDGTCGPQRNRLGLNSEGKRRRHLECGFVEVTGDGIADYIQTERPYQQSPLGEEPNETFAVRQTGLPRWYEEWLPENVSPAYPIQDRTKRRVDLPGRVDFVRNDRADRCEADPVHGRYDIRQFTALRDLTGDGIPDYVYRGTKTEIEGGDPLVYPGVDKVSAGSTGWYVMIGDGVGFRPPLPIAEAEEVPFDLHRALGDCDGNTTSTLASLIDIDGDGSPEVVRAVGENVLAVAELTIDGRAPHGASKLIAVRNGHGATTHISYASAKADHRTPHQVPFPEIVVERLEVSTERGLSQGEPLVPRLFAYGGAERYYHPLLGRWVFPGYQRTVSSRGRLAKTPKGLERRGVALVTERQAYLPFVTSAKRYATVGTVQDQRSLIGKLPTTSWSLLDIPFTGSEERWRANRHFTHGVVSRAVGSAPDETSDECGDLSPFGEGVEVPLLCGKRTVVYTKERTNWEGTSPSPASDSIATRTVVLEVDDYGRPVEVLHEGDRALAIDDLCVTYDYASGPAVRNLVWRTTVSECHQERRKLGEARVEYDDGAAGPGHFTKGFVTGQAVDAYDTNSATLVASINRFARILDAHGNVTDETTSNGHGESRTTSYAYDPFSLVVTDSTTTATSAIAPLQSTTVYEPATLLAETFIDANGTISRQTFDRFGRARTTTVEREDGVEYVLALQDYFGDDGTAVGGRSVRTTVFHEWVAFPDAYLIGAESNVRATVSSEYLDELGRTRFAERHLGADYGGESVVSGYAEHDDFGRVSFGASGFFWSEFPNVFGTTFRYDDGGRILCTIDASGPYDGLATTDEDGEVFPRCFDYFYRGGRGVVSAAGPNELNIGSAQYGVRRETETTATGQIVTRRAVRAGSTLQLMELDYDALGQSTGVVRYADPGALSGRVEWTFTRDSLGRLLQRREPASAAVSFDYDDWNGVVAERWTGDDGADHELRSAYDGFGRLLSYDELRDGVPVEDRRADYFYDVASGDPEQAAPGPLLGRLSHVIDGTHRSYFSYDDVGGMSIVSRVSDYEGGQPYRVLREHGPNGGLLSLGFELPDNDYARENVTFSFDSARRVRSVFWNGAGGAQDLFSATGANGIDALGRYRDSVLGNGVRELHQYRVGGRRELHYKIQMGPIGNRYSIANHFDSSGRLVDRNEFGKLDEWDLTARKTIVDYDEIDRVAARQVAVGGSPVEDLAFEYDGLGNITRVADDVAGLSEVFDIDDVDRDRLCGRAFTALPKPPPDGEIATVRFRKPDWHLRSVPGLSASRDAAPTSCAYTYDARGNVRAIAAEADRPASSYEYDGFSRLVRAQAAGVAAEFRYNGLGELGESIVATDVSKNARVDHHYGPLLRRSQYADGTSGGSYVERTIPLPMGMRVLVRRADNGVVRLLYDHGDSIGTRLVTNESGTEEHTIQYTPYGRVAEEASGEPLSYVHSQWNRGESFSGVGVVMLGDRAYDPRSRRFLQRDPLMLPRTANDTHPYAFSFNDPLGFRDPTGRDGAPNIELQDESHVFVPEPGAWHFESTHRLGDRTLTVACWEGAGCMGFPLALPDVEVPRLWFVKPITIEIEGKKPVLERPGGLKIFANAIATTIATPYIMIDAAMAPPEPVMEGEDWSFDTANAFRPFPYEPWDTESRTTEAWMAFGITAGVGVVSAVRFGAARGAALLSVEVDAPAAATVVAGRGTTALAPVFRSFTRSNFRHNLAKLTGRSPRWGQAHHVFPVKFEARFAGAGINIHDPRFGSWWVTGPHQSTARAYNAAWEGYFLMNPSASADQIFDFGRMLSRQHGFDIYF